jgi:hypothetical protein
MLRAGSTLKRDLQIRERSGLTGKKQSLRNLTLGKRESAGFAGIDAPAQQTCLAGAALPLHASAGVVEPRHQGGVQDRLGLAHLDALPKIDDVNFHLERQKP